ncbi:hypothetical protein [Selenomonas sp. oral taxon 138]|uniref:hypothetical protein n=1 Tax=Selenomonas sp. oral taxon 138 TaxID=712532 RepID=UPI0003460307|nr:hypothetical protein [Selenomonas sp. oral taxon 138]
MAEKIRPDLLAFLKPNAAHLRILVVESLTYLHKLRSMFPQAELYVVAAEPDEAEIDELSEVHWQILDYLVVPLPYTRGFFDYIISDLTFENADNPQDIAAGFSMFLKETGALLTSFRNIRHWSVLQNLMEGHYYNIVSRLYARREFENLLYASFYKSVRVRQQQREAPKDLIERLVTAGFENEQDDLETEFYLVRADRSMPELSLLKSMYTSAERERIVRLIHRIEYDVESAASVCGLWDMVDRLAVFPAYLSSLVRETVVHTEPFYQRISEEPNGRGDFIYEMMDASAMESVDPIERECYRRMQRDMSNGKR